MINCEEFGGDVYLFPCLSAIIWALEGTATGMCSSQVPVDFPLADTVGASFLRTCQK